MLGRWWQWSGLMVIAILVLTACDSSSDNNNNDSPNPDSAVTDEVSAQTTEDITIPTDTPTPVRLSTLPSTFTPTPSVTPTLTITPTFTPEDYNPFGTLLYVYNGDSIVRMIGDGSFSELIVTFGVGAQINDVTLSPDGTLIAFIAPGNGSAREVFVANFEGTYLQQVSCLGFADIRSPTWSPDSASLAFIGAQALNQPANIYTADLAGSGNCPVDNNQRQVVQTDSTLITEVIWHPDGERLFYSDTGIYAVDLSTGEISAPYTQTLGFGSDYGLTFNPLDSNQLVYVQRSRTTQGDTLNVINIGSANPSPSSITNQLPDFMTWSSDGENLLVSTTNSFTSIEFIGRRPTSLQRNLTFPPQAIFTNDNNNFAFVGLDPVNPAIQQVFAYNRRARQITQLTNHPEGTVSDLIWIAE